MPLVVVDNFEPNEKPAAPEVPPVFLFVSPNTKPGPVVVAPNPVPVVPLDGLLRKSKLAPLDGEALNPPKPAKTLGAPSYFSKFI